jgi:hypothetical protein
MFDGSTQSKTLGMVFEASTVLAVLQAYLRMAGIKFATLVMKTAGTSPTGTLLLPTKVLRACSLQSPLPRLASVQLFCLTIAMTVRKEVHTVAMPRIESLGLGFCGRNAWKSQSDIRYFPPK